MNAGAWTGRLSGRPWRRVQARSERDEWRGLVSWAKGLARRFPDNAKVN